MKSQAYKQHLINVVKDAINKHRDQYTKVDFEGQANRIMDTLGYSSDTDYQEIICILFGEEDTNSRILAEDIVSYLI